MRILFALASSKVQKGRKKSSMGRIRAEDFGSEELAGGVVLCVVWHCAALPRGTACCVALHCIAVPHCAVLFHGVMLKGNSWGNRCAAYGRATDRDDIDKLPVVFVVCDKEPQRWVGIQPEEDSNNNNDDDIEERWCPVKGSPPEAFTRTNKRNNVEWTTPPNRKGVLIVEVEQNGRFLRTLWTVVIAGLFGSSRVQSANADRNTRHLSCLAWRCCPCCRHYHR